MSRTATKDHTYTVEVLNPKELLVDRRVQREALLLPKVDSIVANFNPDAVGVLHISRRVDRGLYIIDGWHRDEALKRLDKDKVTCHVFEGLTLAQEAQMFLDLNNANQASVYEKYKVAVEAGDPDTVELDKLVHAMGYTADGSPGPGHINAIRSLQRLWARSKEMDADPNLVQLTLMVISRAWGDDRDGVQGAILDGLGRFISVHKDRINFDQLIERLREYPGGPKQLTTNARQLKVVNRMRVSMAVADLIVKEYNRGRASSSRNVLPTWSYRS